MKQSLPLISNYYYYNYHFLRKSFESRYIARSCVKANVNVNLMRCGDKQDYNVLNITH